MLWSQTFFPYSGRARFGGCFLGARIDCRAYLPQRIARVVTI
jgi:hypothetical protein